MNYDGNLLKLYIDSDFADKYSSINKLDYSLQNTILMLSANPIGNVSSGYFFNGSIYSIRVYDRALNETEIKYNYSIDSARYKR